MAGHADGERLPGLTHQVQLGMTLFRKEHGSVKPEQFPLRVCGNSAASGRISGIIVVANFEDITKDMTQLLCYHEKSTVWVSNCSV